MKAAANCRFIPEFEPIRGLAALTVALMHSFYILQSNPGAVTVAKTLFNGYAAVTTFFLLSGIVLGLALDRYSGTLLARWRQFLILRIFRIYPMIVLVTALICVYLLFFHESRSFPAATDWFNRYYRGELGWYEALQNFLLINVSLNPIAWTLMVEMALAVVFPLFHLVSRRSGSLINATILVALVALAFLAHRINELAPDNPIFTLFCTLVLPHAYKFYLGLLLPAYMNAKLLERTSAAALPYFVLSILVLVLARPAGDWLGMSSTLAVLVESLAAACLLAPFCVSSGRRFASALFDLAIIRWLGRVSYSFYIWHFIALYIIATLLLAQVPGDLIGAMTFQFSAFLAVSSIAISGMVANYSYRFVEVPFMEYGRQFARSLRARPEAATSS
jgi:peptidoglycan/LPS O-acetylase OafA/YrhL